MAVIIAVRRRYGSLHYLFNFARCQWLRRRCHRRRKGRSYGCCYIRLGHSLSRRSHHRTVYHGLYLCRRYTIRHACANSALYKTAYLSFRQRRLDFSYFLLDGPLKTRSDGGNIYGRCRRWGCAAVGSGVASSPQARMKRVNPTRLASSRGTFQLSNLCGYFKVDTSKFYAWQ